MYCLNMLLLCANVIDYEIFINCVTVILIVLTCTSSFAQTNCTGKVIDAATHEPVAHASIQIKNTNQGTITNNKGEFYITAYRYRK